MIFAQDPLLIGQQLGVKVESQRGVTVLARPVSQVAQSRQDSYIVAHSALDGEQFGVAGEGLLHLLGPVSAKVSRSVRGLGEPVGLIVESPQRVRVMIAEQSAPVSVQGGVVGRGLGHQLHHMVHRTWGSLHARQVTGLATPVSQTVASLENVGVLFVPEVPALVSEQLGVTGDRTIDVTRLACPVKVFP
jgi:hypothetical protein